MYPGASAGGEQNDLPPLPVEQAAKALEHMEAALQILDDCKLSAIAGARLDHAIEVLREEIGKTAAD
ncbi:hypothetical protein GCM10023264_11800 [Sphingomonas daechungensis]